MSKTLYGKRWPEDFRRRFFVGMHTVDTDQNATVPDLLRDMDGRQIVRRIADAGGDAVYFYFSCHNGNAFYPTEVAHGHMHSGLEGRDVFGEAADEAQKLQVALIGVYEFANLRQTNFGPREWRHYYPKPGPRNAGKPCWNTGYADLVEGQIDEVARRYPLAGMYVDMLDHPDLVCCEGCAKRFRQDVGVAPPRVRDAHHPLYQVFRLWTFRDQARYLRRLREILQRHQPGATMVNNYHGFTCGDLYEDAEATDYLSTDPAVGFGSKLGTVTHSARMALFGALSRGKIPYEILHDPICVGHINVVPPEPYNGITALPALRGGAQGYPGSMIDRRGKLNPAALGLAREHYAFARARDPWRAEGEPVRFAGLYVSQESEFFYAGAVGGRTASRPFSRYLDEYHGAFLMLQREHLPMEILTRRDLDRLQEYPVVVLPNAVCMSDAEAEALRAYVREGGTLVSSYRTGLANEWNEPREDFALADVFGVSYTGRRADPYRTFDFVLPEGQFSTEPWESRFVAMRQSVLECTLRQGATSLVDIHDRYRPDSDIRYSGMHNYYVKDEPLCPGLVEHRFGRGRSIYCAGKVFSAYLFTGVWTLRKLMLVWPLERERAEACPVRLEAGPASVELGAWAQPERNRVLVHLVNYQSAPGRMNLVPELPLVDRVEPVHDLLLRTTFGVKDIQEAKLQPAGEALAVEERGGRAVVRIPRVHVHEIVELVLRPGACPQYPDSNRVFDFPRPDLRARAQAWLATNPPDYDAADDGALDFRAWRPPEDYITEWRMAGPFPCDPGQGIRRAYGPERDASAEAAYETPAGPVRWQPFSGTDRHAQGWVEMVPHLGAWGETGFVGYLCTTLRSTRDQRVRFWLGNNDLCKVFLDGEEVYAQVEDPKRPTGEDQVRLDLDLTEGEHTLLVKVECIGHGMGVALRAEEPEAELVAAPTPDAPGRRAYSEAIRGGRDTGRGDGQI